ncbi:hypothetical protein LshimejAT787_0905070 [Lyophyllum shimeji]|uniref:DUF6535 domain-containing protein n=1 Tax=Lyophyllum shimeji TaxID=47721 RepID=A0A9P3UQI3_LYOSH|nr:hypothetical protein LshimejAT787_0905070 [Lyophyllum shimeji]
MGSKTQESIPSAYPRRQTHHGVVLKGFELLALAATFVAAIQSQVMSTTIGVARSDETPALRAVNAFYLSGLVFDLVSAFLAFLTARWLQRLTDEERAHLEVVFEQSHSRRFTRASADAEADVEHDPQPPAPPLPDKRPFVVRCIHAYFASSLFAPMTLLVFGVICMAVGFLIFAWAEQPLVVAIVLTAVCAGLVPFPVGVFLIGRNSATRRRVIDLLSRKQGDW